MNSPLKFHFISPSVKAVQVLYWGESLPFGGSHVSSVTDISSLCFVLRVEITIVWYGVKHICRYSFWLLEFKIYRTLRNGFEEIFHWFEAVLSRIAICPTDAGKTRRAKERTLKEINRQQIQKGKTPWVFFSIVQYCSVWIESCYCEKKRRFDTCSFATVLRTLNIYISPTITVVSHMV